MNNSRFMLAASSSGCGKTTLTCAILAALKNMGVNPAAFKCGPDYLDTMFHTSVIGVDSTNLDPFFSAPEELRTLIAKHTDNADVGVIEGVMGYYDGVGEDGLENSTYSVASDTDTPVILIVNGKGASTSVLAQLYGFLNYVPDSKIRGVIVNRTTPMTYERIKKLISSRFGGAVVPVGYFPNLPEKYTFESRHLGLVTAAEVEELEKKLEYLAKTAAETIDFSALLNIASAADKIEYAETPLPYLGNGKIAVARDKAFCFYYPETLNLLKSMGAEIEYFSPLNNEPLPEGAAGLYIGGGYPELYADVLEKNTAAKESIREAVLSGMPTIAECGGFMYLTEKLDGRKMCGALPGECEKKAKLVRFGYTTLLSDKKGLFGESFNIKSHEFHYYDCTENGEDAEAVKKTGARYKCAVYTDSLYAGYPHLYLPSSPDAAAEFYKKCLKWSSKK